MMHGRRNIKSYTYVLLVFLIIVYMVVCFV